MNGVIAWFASHRVVANLLMITIIGSGVLTMTHITLETFPEFSLDMITVTVVYRGAAPTEVEEGVCVRIEEQLQGLDGIERITSTATEGVGVVTVELQTGTDPRKLLDDVKARVDGIDTFPEETEKPIVQEILNRREVLSVAIAGDAEEKMLKEIGERVRDEILAIEGITLVDLAAVRPYEISIELSEEALRRHGISFDAVVRAVRAASIDLPGGSVKADGGEILLRTKGQAYRGEEFENLVLLSRPDGTRLRLGDVAHVVDGFEDTDQIAYFNGERSVVLKVYRVGDQSVLDISEKVKAYVEEARERLPDGISITTWADMSKVLRDRLSLLFRNGRNGFLLVFAVLAIFLRFRLAFWVSLGIPISFLGAIWLMPAMDVTVNLISLFAFIVVLGIVVDDAIVVGENIFRHQEKEKDSLKGAIDGAREVATPVTFAVLTTVAAFAPLLAVEGMMGKIMRVIPLIVIPVLLFSLVESLLILPHHLSHRKEHTGDRKRISAAWRRFQGRFTRLFRRFVDRAYLPSLDIGLRWRYATVAWGVLTLLVTIGVVRGGHIRFTFMPEVDGDYISVALTMPQGTPVDVTAEATGRLEAAAHRVQEQLEADGHEGTVKYFLTSIGEQPFTSRSGPGGGFTVGIVTGSHLGEVVIELKSAEDRDVSSADVARLWREEAGPIPDALEVKYSSALFSAGADIEVQLTGRDVDRLRSAAGELKERIAGYEGTTDIADTFRPGKRELELRIKPSGEAAGLTQADLARQVRQGFFGAEAQRIQRGRDDVRVMVRYPEEDRRSLGDLDEMRVRTPLGAEVPFYEVAEVDEGRGYASIRRIDRKRAVTVTAKVDPARGNANQIIADLADTILPEILADHEGVDFSFEGSQREQRKSLAGLARGFAVALLIIFVLMAIPFRSYSQPLLVMSAIPFGLVGAVWGHLIMGYNLTFLSLFGAVALTGVVVNDSLVLVDRVNRFRAGGLSLDRAIRLGGEHRFRPIVLTSVTTFAGLSPLLFEKSMQAQFLIPMTVSLAFGVIFATFVTLMIVPAGYLILEDLKDLGRRVFATVRSSPTSPE